MPLRRAGQFSVAWLQLVLKPATKTGALKHSDYPVGDLFCKGHRCSCQNGLTGYLRCFRVQQNNEFVYVLVFLGLRSRYVAMADLADIGIHSNTVGDPAACLTALMNLDHGSLPPDQLNTFAVSLVKQGPQPIRNKSTFVLLFAFL